MILQALLLNILSRDGLSLEPGLILTEGTVFETNFETNFETL